MKKFNVTGVCSPETNYMIDISGKIVQIKKKIDNMGYFSIGDAPKYGKSTILKQAEQELKDKYTIISLNFNKYDVDYFGTEEKFCIKFIGQVADSLRRAKPEIEKTYIEKWSDYSITDLSLLDKHISKMCKKQKIVLIIDDTDRSRYNQVFSLFLKMLKAKHIARVNSRGKMNTFHSIVFAELYDAEHIELFDGIHSKPSNNTRNCYVDLSFRPAEIAAMLKEYEADHNTGMDIAEISEEIYNCTHGYPFLVSKICKHIDEDLSKDWSPKGVRKSESMFLESKNILFMV